MKRIVISLLFALSLVIGISTSVATASIDRTDDVEMADVTKHGGPVVVRADPGDQSWFLCVSKRPYGVGQVYNDFMISGTVAQCFVDYSYNPGLPSCPNLYAYQVWWTPAYGGWTGRHDIQGPYC